MKKIISNFILKNNNSPKHAKHEKKRNDSWMNFVVSMCGTVFCVALLVGLTFAWYTSTTQSAAQVIQSGNLVAELSYLTGYGEDNSYQWADATASGVKLFGDELIDPGDVFSTVIRVKNGGDIGFHYDMHPVLVSKTIGRNVEGQDVDLSELVKVAIIDLEAAENWKDTVNGSIQTALSGTTRFLNCYSPENFSGDTMGGDLNKDAVHYYAVALYVPESANLAYDPSQESYRPDFTLIIQLRASQILDSNTSAPLPWDGVTTKEVTPADNVYSVGTNAELKYVLDLLGGSSMPAGNYTIQLTANIEMSSRPVELKAPNASVNITINGTVEGGGSYAIQNFNMKTSNTEITIETPKLFDAGDTVTYTNVSFPGIRVTRPDA